nr:hypothetical protein [Chlamydia pneumoniae]
MHPLHPPNDSLYPETSAQHVRSFPHPQAASLSHTLIHTRLQGSKCLFKGRLRHTINMPIKSHGYLPYVTSRSHKAIHNLTSRFL